MAAWPQCSRDIRVPRRRTRNGFVTALPLLPERGEAHTPEQIPVLSTRVCDVRSLVRGRAVADVHQSLLARRERLGFGAATPLPSIAARQEHPSRSHLDQAHPPLPSPVSRDLDPGNTDTERMDLCIPCEQQSRRGAIAIAYAVAMGLANAARTAAQRYWPAALAAVACSGCLEAEGSGQRPPEPPTSAQLSRFASETLPVAYWLGPRFGDISVTHASREGGRVAITYGPWSCDSGCVDNGGVWTGPRDLDAISRFDYADTADRPRGLLDASRKGGRRAPRVRSERISAGPGDLLRDSGGARHESLHRRRQGRDIRPDGRAEAEATQRARSLAAVASSTAELPRLPAD